MGCFYSFDVFNVFLLIFQEYNILQILRLEHLKKQFYLNYNRIPKHHHKSPLTNMELFLLYDLKTDCFYIRQ